MRLPLLAVLSASLAPLALAQLEQWTDAAGNTVYGSVAYGADLPGGLPNPTQSYPSTTVLAGGAAATGTSSTQSSRSSSSSTTLAADLTTTSTPAASTTPVYDDADTTAPASTTSSRRGGSNAQTTAVADATTTTRTDPTVWNYSDWLKAQQTAMSGRGSNGATVAAGRPASAALALVGAFVGAMLVA